MIYGSIDGFGYMYEEKYKIIDNFRTWLIWRLANTNITKEKYLYFIENIRNF